MTGVWSVSGEEGLNGGTVPLQASISYLQKIEPAPVIIYVKPGGTEAISVNPATGENAEVPVGSESEIAARCGVAGPTAVANPSAKPGNLCVFIEAESGIHPVDYFKLIFDPGTKSGAWVSPAPEYGATIPFTMEKEEVDGEELIPASPGGFARGSWAVAK